jgi:hypothetical protein
VKLQNIILIVKTGSVGGSSNRPGIRADLQCGSTSAKRPSVVTPSLARRRGCDRGLSNLTNFLLKRLKGSGFSSEFSSSQAATRSRVARIAVSNQIQTLTPGWIAGASRDQSRLFLRKRESMAINMKLPSQQRDAFHQLMEPNSHHLSQCKLTTAAKQKL